MYKFGRLSLAEAPRLLGLTQIETLKKGLRPLFHLFHPLFQSDDLPFYLLTGEIQKGITVT